MKGIAVNSFGSKLIASVVIVGVACLYAVPAAFAASPSLDVYGGPAANLVEVSSGGAPLPSTGLALGALVVVSLLVLAAGMFARRLAEQAS